MTGEITSDYWKDDVIQCKPLADGNCCRDLKKKRVQPPEYKSVPKRFTSQFEGIKNRKRWIARLFFRRYPETTLKFQNIPWRRDDYPSVYKQVFQAIFYDEALQ